MANLFAEPNHLCNFGRGHHEEQFCEIVLIQELLVKDVLSRVLAPLCCLSGTICALSVEGIMRNNTVKLF